MSCLFFLTRTRRNTRSKRDWSSVVCSSVLRHFHDVVFRVGDRVLQLVNQPKDHVYNGDIGEIVQIFSPKENEENEEQIIVQFDENEVVYTRKTWEYDACVLYIHP